MHVHAEIVKLLTICLIIQMSHTLSVNYLKYTLNTFIVLLCKQILIVFCKPEKLSNYHNLGLYSLRINHEGV